MGEILDSASAVSIRDLTVRFGSRAVLEEISLEIRRGEFIGIFGPNGAGKSTLIQCLLGLLRPTSGEVKILGQPPQATRQDVGYMPQRPETPERTSLTPRNLVAAVHRGTAWGIPLRNREAREEVQSVLEKSGAAAYADKPVAVLSGGERQRVALAQALLGSPRILILDEPLASLDPHRQSQLVENVASISRSEQITTLFVAHDINPLLGVMNRVLYVAGGRALLGTPDEVLTSEALSDLYGIEMKVIRAEGQIMILTGSRGIMESARHG